MNAPARTGATMRRGKSKQDYGTPRDFIAAVESRFGALAWDLAADATNAKADRWLGPGGIHEDALVVPWHTLDGLQWLNCPFSHIEPWAEKCAIEAPLGANVLLLTPASIGSNWFADHVHRKACVLGLSPRLTFEGTSDPYPKDLMLSVFGPFVVPCFDVWRWKP